MFFPARGQLRGGGLCPRAGLCFLVILWLVFLQSWAPASEIAPPLPSIHVPFTASPPAFDGKLGDSAWEKAALVELPCVLGSPAFPPEKTSVRLLYDATFLYVAFQAWDTDSRQTARIHDDIQMHQDDCVELFLATPVHQIPEALGFEINARGDVLDYRLRPEEFININWSPKRLQIASSHGTAPDVFTGYIIELAIPWAELKRATAGAEPPARLRANFARYDYGSAGRVLTTWSDPQSRFNTPSNLEGYGWLLFDPPQPCLGGKRP